jgi:5-methylcytosine-specific restriction endonuclease McrA
MKFLEAEARNAGRSGLAYYHAHWTRDGAPLLDELGAVIDHVDAFSTGGLDSEENLITACNKCNGRKSAAPLDRWNKRSMHKPIKGKYGEPRNWDGLASVFVMLAERNPAPLTVGERDWLNAIKSNGN